MNRTSWEQILKESSESIGVGKEVIIIFKTARDHVRGVIKEIGEVFPVLENKDGRGITYCGIGEWCWFQNSLMGKAQEVPYSSTSFQSMLMTC